MRPPHEPVTVVDRVLGLDSAAGQDGDDASSVAFVAVALDGRVLEVPVLHLVGGSVGLLELLLARPVDDVAVGVDGVPRADERLG